MMRLNGMREKLGKLLSRPLASGTNRGERGMSLIEIIIVIALMGTLMTIVITNLTGKQEDAMRDAAKLSMGQLETTLQMYKVHNYRYPTTDEGLDALMRAPATAKNWRGPYTDEKKLNDPWGNRFGYESDGKTFKLKSGGPNGNEEINYPDDGPPPQQ